MKKSIELSEIKKIELDILKEFDKFCKDNNIQYYLAYGTLLGAIRHKGFIPWDDDIDVCMLKEDYRRLIKKYKNNRYRLMSAEREKRNSYTYAYAKLVDTETVLIEKARPIKGMGINIDIFPLDYLKGDICSAQNKIKKRYDRINYLETAVGFKGKLLKLFGTKNISRFNSILEKLGGKSDIVGNCCSINSYWDYYDIKSFEKTTEVTFEGEKFPAPIEYDEVLKASYNNYMELPPKEEQQAHHEFEAFWKE